MGKRGRPKIEITEDIIEAICQEISRGVPVEHACIIGGISKGTYYNWLHKGEEEPEDSDSMYRFLVDKVEEAKAYAIATRVESIRIAGQTTWQASAWWLERMDYEHFGKKQAIDTTLDATVKSEDISKLFDNEIVTSILQEEKETEDEN